MASPPDLILYTAGRLGDRFGAKTATGILRFAPERVRSVLDPRHAGRPLGDVCPWFDDLDLPVVGTLAEAGDPGDRVVVGFAPRGSRFAGVERDLLQAAADAGYTVLNGLHEALNGPNVVNLRAWDPAEGVIASRPALDSTRVLTVGASSNIGKMTVTLRLHESLRAAGVDADWVATGQTGLILKGDGRVIDAGPIDFVPGMVERLVLEAEERARVLVIEGQGSIYHPAYSPTTLALIHASRPQYYVMCHRVGAQNWPTLPDSLRVLERAIGAHNRLVTALGLRSELLGIALDSHALSTADYREEQAAATERFDTPCVDVVRESADPLAARFRERAR